VNLIRSGGESGRYDSSLITIQIHFKKEEYITFYEQLTKSKTSHCFHSFEEMITCAPRNQLAHCLTKFVGRKKSKRGLFIP